MKYLPLLIIVLIAFGCTNDKSKANAEATKGCSFSKGLLWGCGQSSSVESSNGDSVSSSVINGNTKTDINPQKQQPTPIIINNNFTPKIEQNTNNYNNNKTTSEAKSNVNDNKKINSDNDNSKAIIDSPCSKIDSENKK